MKVGHSNCGILLIALPLTDDGRLRTLLKCSAHLSNIASLSVRSVLLSALSSGVAQELLGIKLFSMYIGTFSYPSSRKRPNFFCFLFRPGSLSVRCAAGTDDGCMFIARQRKS